MEKKSERDQLVVDIDGTQWISIKDASDKMGCSERHAWRIASEKKWQSKKQHSGNRLKTYVLQADVNAFKNEISRVPADSLKSTASSSDNPDMSDKNKNSDTSDKPLSDVERWLDLSDNACQAMI